MSPGLRKTTRRGRLALTFLPLLGLAACGEQPVTSTAVDDVVDETVVDEAFEPVGVHAFDGRWPVELEYTTTIQEQPRLDSPQTTTTWVFRGESWASWTNERIAGGIGSGGGFRDSACFRLENRQFSDSWVGCDGPWEPAGEPLEHDESGVNPHVRGWQFTATEAARLVADADDGARALALALGLPQASVGRMAGERVTLCGEPEVEFLKCEPGIELVNRSERVFDLASGLQLLERDWVNGQLIHEYVVRRVTFGADAP